MPKISTRTIRLWDAGGWRSRAACHGTGPDLFFPHGETADDAAEQTARARKVCAGCPVRLHCLTFALAAHPLDGIWGGLTVSQRTRLRYRRLHRRTAAGERGPAASSWPEAGRSDRRPAVYDDVIGSHRPLDRQGCPAGGPELGKAGLAVGGVGTDRALMPAGAGSVAELFRHRIALGGLTEAECGAGESNQGGRS